MAQFFMKYLITIRHEKHKNNILAPETIADCKNRGAKLLVELKNRQIALPSLAISSNLSRAVDTLKCILDGMNLNLPISEYEEFSDYRSGKFPYTEEEFNSAVLAGKKNSDTEYEKYLLFLYPEKSKLRAEESIKVLNKIIANCNGNIIFCSHGCSRLEQIISVLQNKPVNQPNFIFERGGIALLGFSDHAEPELLSVEYMGLLD